MRCRETPAWTHLLISDQREHASMDPWKKKHSHQTKRTWAKKGAICNHLKRSLSCMLSLSSFPSAAFCLFFLFTTSGSTVWLSRKATIKDTRNSQSHIEKLCTLPWLQTLHHGNWPSPWKQTVAWLEVHSILLSFWMTAELCWTQAPPAYKVQEVEIEMYDSNPDQTFSRWSEDEPDCLLLQITGFLLSENMNRSSELEGTISAAYSWVFG